MDHMEGYMYLNKSRACMLFIFPQYGQKQQYLDLLFQYPAGRIPSFFDINDIKAKTIPSVNLRHGTNIKLLFYDRHNCPYEDINAIHWLISSRSLGPTILLILLTTSLKWSGLLFKGAILLLMLNRKLSKWHVYIPYISVCPFYHSLLLVEWKHRVRDKPRVSRGGANGPNVCLLYSL